MACSQLSVTSDGKYAFLGANVLQRVYPEAESAFKLLVIDIHSSKKGVRSALVPSASVQPRRNDGGPIC